jgi:glycosyltransferase involved in cell wall biosynthesis
MSVHVVHIIDHLGAGGAQRLLADLTVRQMHQGVKVTLISLRGATDLSRRIGATGVAVHTLGCAKWSLRQLSLLRTLIRNLQPEVVHLHLMAAHILGRIAAVIAGVPAVVVHDHEASAEIYTHPGPLLALRRLYEPAAPPTRTAYIALSPEAVEYAVTIRHWPRSAVYCVPNGVDTAHIAEMQLGRTEARTLLGLPHASLILGCAGRLSPVKGVDCLLDALADLPAHVSLAVAGDGPQRPELDQRARRLGIAQRVHWLGHLADPRPFLRACNIYVQPSRREAFGLAVAEAAVAGLPIVATRVGGLRDLIHHEATGLLVQPDHPHELAAAIQRLIGNPDMAQRYGLAAQAHVCRHFDLSASVEQIGAIYRTLLQPKDCSCHTTTSGALNG